jgi:CheY-like chemotaxis protein
MSELSSILYVEDDARSRKILHLLLNPIAQLTSFEDSTDFLERLAALQPAPDLILLDIHVKPYNGFEMLAMVRQLEQFTSTPVVALTASVMNEEVDQLRTAGFNSVIAKPIDVDTFPELLARIHAGETIWRIIS